MQANSSCITPDEISGALQSPSMMLPTLGPWMSAIMTVCLQGVAQTSGFDHRWLLNECTLVLKTQSKASKPDQGYMAGALAGLSLALAQCQVTGIHLTITWQLPGIYLAITWQLYPWAHSKLHAKPAAEPHCNVVRNVCSCISISLLGSCGLCSGPALMRLHTAYKQGYTRGSFRCVIH